MATMNRSRSWSVLRYGVSNPQAGLSAAAVKRKQDTLCPLCEGNPAALAHVAACPWSEKIGVLPATASSDGTDLQDAACYEVPLAPWRRFGNRWGRLYLYKNGVCGSGRGWLRWQASL